MSCMRRRFESAKLLLELDETVNTAVEILESLLEENDSVPDVYQLLAMCLFGGGEHQEVRRLRSCSMAPWSFCHPATS